LSLGNKEPEIVEKPELKKKYKMGKVAKGVASLAGGIGAVTGGTGGVLLGAGIGTAGATVSGLLLKDLSLAALGKAGLWGAVIGGGTLAIASAVGGYKIVEFASKAINKGKDVGENVIDAVSDAAKPKEEVK